MSNEYDYSGLYDHTNTPSGTPDGAADPAAQNSAPQQSAYPNVGSSGMNTANTARTDYSTASQPGGSANAGTSYTGGYTAQSGSADSNGYTSSFSGGGSGSANGYSYASAPQQPAPKPKKQHRVLLRVLAGLGVVVLGFGSGLAGAVVASRTGLTGGQVVVQQVQRAASDAENTGSTGGEGMSISQIASVVSPSVVAITTEQMSGSQTWFGGYYVQSGAGSGVIISEDGYILTCAHVVNGATSIQVQLDNGDTYDAAIVGQDTTSDVAVIKVEATGLTPAVIGDSNALAVGETVVAVGNPLGTLSNTVTNGIISALNSGGGLFNANGELIGIVNAKSSYSEAEGIGFAIPIDSGMEIAQQLIENGSVVRPALGVQIYEVTDASTAARLGVNATGVYVVEVTAGGGAEAAGVKAGDRLIAIDDTAVTSNNAVKSYLNDKQVGDTVTLQVEREGKVLTMEVTLGSSAG